MTGTSGWTISSPTISAALSKTGGESGIQLLALITKYLPAILLKTRYTELLELFPFTSELLPMAFLRIHRYICARGGGEYQKMASQKGCVQCNEEKGETNLLDLMASMISKAPEQIFPGLFAQAVADLSRMVRTCPLLSSADSLTSGPPRQVLPCSERDPIVEVQRKPFCK